MVLVPSAEVVLPVLLVVQVMSTDNAFIRVKKGVYTLRCWASQLPPQLDQGAAGASGGAKVGGMLSSGCV